MKKYFATVEFETKKGMNRTADVEVLADSAQGAERAAGKLIMDNGQRQAKRILDVRVSSTAPDRIGLLGFLFHKLRGRFTRSNHRAHA